MTNDTTQQAYPALPKPRGLDDHSKVPTAGYTADQMRAYVDADRAARTAAAPAQAVGGVSDEQIDDLIRAAQRHLGGWTGGSKMRDEAVGKARADMRAILALRPAPAALQDVASGNQGPEAKGVPIRPPMHFCRPAGLRYELPPLVITGHQLREALAFLAPESTTEQLEQEVSIALRDEGRDIEGYEAPRGMYCWLTEYPEEGSLLIKGATQPEAAPQGGGGVDRYWTQPAESLMGIALRQLKDESRWTEIRDLNAASFPDMGPHDYYPVGTALRMPNLAAPAQAGSGQGSVSDTDILGAMSPHIRFDDSPNGDNSTDDALRAGRAVLALRAGRVASTGGDAQVVGERGSPEYINALADLADPDQLWRRAGMDQRQFTDRQRHQMDAGVYLRRHAAHVERLRGLIGTGQSLLLTPLSPAGTDVRNIDTPDTIRAARQSTDL